MSTVRVKGKNLPPVSNERLEALKALADEEIDYSDTPEIGEESPFWTQANLIYPTRTAPVTLRIEEDMLQWFKLYASRTKDAKGYQSVMKAVLRTFMAHHLDEKS